MSTFKRIACGLMLMAVALTAAQPVQLTAILTLSATGITTGLSVPGLYVAQSGTRYLQGVQTFPITSGGTALNVTGLANIGYCQFVNLDVTNYVQLMTAVSGTVVLRMVAGDAQLFRFDPSITAPAFIAHTASVSIQYLCLEN
jgi:hypothetical protein